MVDEQFLSALARIALPTLNEHSVDALAGHYGIEAEDGEREFEAVFLKLAEELEAFPPGVIEEANWLLGRLTAL